MVRWVAAKVGEWVLCGPAFKVQITKGKSK